MGCDTPAWMAPRFRARVTNDRRNRKSYRAFILETISTEEEYWGGEQDHQRLLVVSVLISACGGRQISSNHWADTTYEHDGAPGDHMTTPIEAEAPSSPLASRREGQPLAFKLKQRQGVRVDRHACRGHSKDVTVTAWTYSGTAQTAIRVTEGDKVRVVVKNELPEWTVTGTVYMSQRDGRRAGRDAKAYQAGGDLHLRV
jgi:hypothetical protein